MTGTPFDLHDRVAIITGGAGLLGEQHARVLAAAGARILLADVDGDAATRMAARVAADTGGDVRGIACDVGSAQDVQRAVDAATATFGRLDILINNAAMTVKGGGDRAQAYFAPVESYPLDLWNEALRVNLTGTFLCCQAAGRIMVQQGRGVILNIASDVGVISPDHRIYEGARSPHTGLPFNTPPAYATTKAGVIHLTKYLATYWAKQGIRVNALSPGGIRTTHEDTFVQQLTSRIPMGRMAKVDEYQSAVLFLVSDASSYMTGANIIVDGGRTAW